MKRKTKQSARKPNYKSTGSGKGHIGHPRCEGKIPYYSHREGALKDRQCIRRQKIGKLCKKCAQRKAAA
jgi:hypothetical protein